MPSAVGPFCVGYILFLIIQKPYCRVTDFRLRALAISPGWSFTMQNQWLHQGTTNTHNECLVCNEHKTFWEFKVVTIISALFVFWYLQRLVNWFIPSNHPGRDVFKMIRYLKSLVFLRTLVSCREPEGTFRHKFPLSLRLKHSSVVNVNNAHCYTARLFWSWVVLSPYWESVVCTVVQTVSVKLL